MAKRQNAKRRPKGVPTRKFWVELALMKLNGEKSYSTGWAVCYMCGLPTHFTFVCQERTCFAHMSSRAWATMKRKFPGGMPRFGADDASA